MTLLRRVVSTGALLLGLSALSLVAAPGPIVEGLLDQASPPDHVWIRLLGTAGFTLALVHVLILRKLEELWWWCWAFVLFDGAFAVIAILHAAVGLPEGSAAWPWWLSGLVSASFTVLYLGGLARAGQEKPFA